MSILLPWQNFKFSQWVFLPAFFLCRHVKKTISCPTHASGSKRFRGYRDIMTRRFNKNTNNKKHKNTKTKTKPKNGTVLACKGEGRSWGQPYVKGRMGRLLGWRHVRHGNKQYVQGTVQISGMLCCAALCCAGAWGWWQRGSGCGRTCAPVLQQHHRAWRHCW